MVTDLSDLNERVQVRIEDYALEVQGSQSNEGATILRLVESWRERWDRHKPYMIYGEKHCQFCTADFDSNEYEWQRGGEPVVLSWPWPCPDASSVLREIGIEP